MNALQLFACIASTSSTKEKEALLSQADDVARVLMKAAMDPYVTYGIKNLVLQPPTRQWATDDASLAVYVVEFTELLGLLAQRELTGNDARTSVQTFLSSVPTDVAAWFHRVLLKDLDIGVTAKTVNKVFSKLIPSFDVQLAEDLKNDISKVTYPVWVDYKLDGIRVIAIRDGDNLQFLSRKGHPIDVLTSLAATLLWSPIKRFVLDGEAMGRNWNETQSTLFATKNKVDDTNIMYNVFDCIPYEEWAAQSSITSYRQRRQTAQEVVQSIASTRVCLVGGEVVHNEEQLRAFNDKALQAGHEGVMLKNLDAPYQFKRSKHVCKLKPFSTWEGTIISWEKGAATSKWASSFGAFQVRFEGSTAITSVGGGYTDEDREEFTAHLKEDPTYYNGKIMEVKGQEMTKDGLIRFPVFVRFRDTKDK